MYDAIMCLYLCQVMITLFVVSSKDNTFILTRATLFCSHHHKIGFLLLLLTIIVFHLLCRKKQHFHLQLLPKNTAREKITLLLSCKPKTLCISQWATDEFA